MTTYIVLTEFGATVVQRNNDDGSTSYIPEDLDNADYQAYLASLDETTTK